MWLSKNEGHIPSWHDLVQLRWLQVKYQQFRPADNLIKLLWFGLREGTQFSTTDHSHTDQGHVHVYRNKGNAAKNKLRNL